MEEFAHKLLTLKYLAGTGNLSQAESRFYPETYRGGDPLPVWYRPGRWLTFLNRDITDTAAAATTAKKKQAANLLTRHLRGADANLPNDRRSVSSLSGSAPPVDDYTAC